MCGEQWGNQGLLDQGGRDGTLPLPRPAVLIIRIHNTPIDIPEAANKTERRPRPPLPPAPLTPLSSNYDVHLWRSGKRASNYPLGSAMCPLRRRIIYVLINKESSHHLPVCLEARGGSRGCVDPRLVRGGGQGVHGGGQRRRGAVWMEHGNN